jgi:hypothetical protein
LLAGEFRLVIAGHVEFIQAEKEGCQVIAKIAETGSLAKSGSAIIDDAEIFKAELEKAFRRGYEEGVLEVANKYGARLLLREPEPPVNRVDMLERATDSWFDKVSSILKGVELDYTDQSTRQAAAARMVQNMIEHPATFAKSIFNPSFKGRAGHGRAGDGGIVSQRDLVGKLDE